MNYASSLIKVAQSEVGYLEKASASQLDSKTANAGHGNYTKYAKYLDDLGDFYNYKKNGFDWCDIFVDYCFVKAFGKTEALKLLNQPLKSCGAGCRFSADYYKAKGQFYKTNPKVGDQIFFSYSAGEVSHTGIVIKVDSKYVYTIEGNTYSGNKEGVFEHYYSLTNSCIYGYGRPKYDVEKTTTTTTTTKPTITTKPTTSTTLKVGDKVKMAKNATVYGKSYKFSSFVYNVVLYVREIDGSRVVVSIYKTGAITGAVDKKYLTKC